MPGAPIAIELKDVSKRYTRRSIFQPVSLSLAAGEILAITGPNGCGKTTLLKIIAKVLPPTKGSCEWVESGKKLDDDAVRHRIGYVGPYLELYDELTAVEHVDLVATLKGVRSSSGDSLTSFGLAQDVVMSPRRMRAYSSGMRQRVRFAMAWTGAPQVLLLDEPTSNLDETGIETILSRIQQAAAGGAIVVLATNEARERAIATREYRLQPV